MVHIALHAAESSRFFSPPTLLADCWGQISPLRLPLPLLAARRFLSATFGGLFAAARGRPAPPLLGRGAFVLVGPAAVIVPLALERDAFAEPLEDGR